MTDEQRTPDEDEFLAAIDGDLDLAEVSGLTVNVTGDERCEWCGDDGWLELDRVVVDQGVTYTGFLAPCILCEYGERIGSCLATGTNRYFGARASKEEPWRAIRDVCRDYPTTQVRDKVGRFRRLLTMDEYALTDVGTQDTGLHALRKRLADFNTRHPRSRRSVRAREATPTQAVTGEAAPRPVTRPTTPASGGLGSFAQLAGGGGTVAPHDERSDT